MALAPDEGPRMPYQLLCSKYWKYGNISVTGRFPESMKKAGAGFPGHCVSCLS